MVTNKLINVAVVDTYQLFREALTSLLDRTPGFSVAGQASSCDELAGLLEGAEPDVVLLSTELTGMSVPACVVAIRAYHPTIPLLLLITNDEARKLPVPEEAPNVSRFLLQRASGEQLVQAIRACVVSSPKPRKHSAAPNHLTRQEEAILRLVLTQYSNEEIAATLHKSVRTVEGHRRNIYQKMGAQNIAGIMRVALRQGLVSLDELEYLAKLKAGDL